MSSVTPELWTGLGAAVAMFLASFGSCYASAKSGIFLMKNHSDMGAKALCPIIISGVLAIYGMIIGVLLSFKIDGKNISGPEGFTYFGAGWVVGTACLCSGWGMGFFLDYYMKMNFETGLVGVGERQPLIANGTSHGSSSKNLMEGPSYLYFLSIFVFLEAIGLYGLIVALFMIGK